MTEKNILPACDISVLELELELEKDLFDTQKVQTKT